MASKSVKRFKQGARVWQTDRQTDDRDRAMEKCVAIGGIACAKEIPPKNTNCCLIRVCLMSACSVHIVASGRVSTATAWEREKESSAERLRRHTKLDCCRWQKAAADANQTVQGRTVGCLLIVSVHRVPKTSKIVIASTYEFSLEHLHLTR